MEQEELTFVDKQGLTKCGISENTSAAEKVRRDAEEIKLHSARNNVEN